jgi:hypothetical protein
MKELPAPGMAQQRELCGLNLAQSETCRQIK